MPPSLGVSASFTAETDREIDIANCATRHVERVALLYPGYCIPNYHVDVFKDIEELWFITLTTNEKDIIGKDSRAVGIPDIWSPFTSDEAKDIVARTTFVSHSATEWEMEVKSSTHSGSLVEARTGIDHDHADEHEDPVSGEAMADHEKAESEYHAAGVTNEDVQSDEVQVTERELEKEYEAIQKAKDEILGEEDGQVGRIMKIDNLKQELARTKAELRARETMTLPAMRQDIKNMDIEYYKKLKEHEDRKVSRRKDMK